MFPGLLWDSYLLGWNNCQTMRRVALYYKETAYTPSANVCIFSYIDQVTPIYREWLYVFVPVRAPLPPPPPPAADFCSPYSFRITFRISFIFGRIDGPDLMTWLDFWSILGVSLTYNFQFKYGTCYISGKITRLPRNEKQTYRLNFTPQMRPWDLTLALAFTDNFQGHIWNLLYLSQIIRLTRNEKQTH